MGFNGFQEYKPGSSRYNGRISEDEWNRHKPTLRKLHEAKLTRQQILDIISKDFGDTKPTYGQLCTKFDKWGFHVYRIQPKKGAAKEAKKAKGKAINDEVVDDASDRRRAFTPESSDGSSTAVPDVSNLVLYDESTPTQLTDIPETPEPHQLESSWPEASPRTNHYKMINDQSYSPANGNIYALDPPQNGAYYNQYGYPDGGPAHRWVSANSSSTTAVSHGHSSSTSDTVFSTTPSRPLKQNIDPEMNHMEPDDPVTIAARTQKADSALGAVNTYLKSLGRQQLEGNHILAMTSLAAYLFATRSYSSAFRIYQNIYEIMSNDAECEDFSKVGALMRCCQSATEPSDLEFMQRELHEALRWNLSDSSLGAFTATMLQSVETQISEGFNLTQGNILATTPIMRNLNALGSKGCNSTYPGTRQLYWRLRLLTHSPFHSGCTRLLKIMCELLSWAWAAMTLVPFDDPAITNATCLCKDGSYFDFVRMITTALLQAAVGFDIPELIKMQHINKTPCACVMCADLATTFEICPIETFTAVALLTVDRCRLDWTSCHPGGRHQELTPRTILHEQVLPTIESLLVQVSADIQSLNTIHTSDLYDDFLNSLWSCFETHDLPLRNARFDASTEKVNLLLTNLTTEELNKSHPARKSMSMEPGAIEQGGPVFTYTPEESDLNSRITAKRTRSNASSLKPTSSNASERSMIRIRKKLKYRTSADYLNSMSSYSSLSSRNSMNRFSYVTGLPELETVMDGEVDELGREIPPDITPDEFRTMQRHDSWRVNPDHYSWVPSRPGSQVNRTASWRESYQSMGYNGAGYTYRDSNMGMGSRPGSQVNRRISGRDGQPSHGQLSSSNQTIQRKESQPGLGNQVQNQQQSQPQTQPQKQVHIPNYGDMGPPSDPPSYPLPAPPTTQNQIQTQMQTQPQPQSHTHTHNQIHISNPIQPPPQAQIQPPQVQPQLQLQPQPQTQVQQQQQQPQPQNQHHQFVAPAQPVRRDSTKTTNSSKTAGSSKSLRGRWSAEQERVDKILRATP